jgi:hypothetical protein
LLIRHASSDSFFRRMIILRRSTRRRYFSLVSTPGDTAGTVSYGTQSGISPWPDHVGF